jgi:pSer/pThr/pTyr-binding forkhead associated (FHA) protein
MPKDRPTTVRAAYNAQADMKKWVLQSSSDNTTDKVINIKSGTMVIGRNASCDIILDDEMISSQHAKLRFSDGIIKLKDLNSTNGTYVNGKKINESVLFDGYDISFDMVSFKLKALPSSSSPKTKIRSAVSIDKPESKPAPAPDAFKPAPDAFKMERAPDDPPQNFSLESKASLEIIQGQSNKPRYNLEGGSFIFGRLGTSDIALQDEAVSNFHALLSRIDDQWILKDYGSANGTYINNIQITRQALKHGDSIRLGHTVIRYTDPEKSNAADSENQSRKKVRAKERMYSIKILLPILIFSLISLIGIVIYLIGDAQW